MTRRTPGRRARVALLALLVAVPLGGCAAPDPAPAKTSMSPSAPPAASAPAASAPAASAPALAADALAFHPEGRIDDLPPNAPEADVVARLTERLGAAPETLDEEQACEGTGQPGRLLSWPGLRLFVLTTDPEGGEAAPYAGGWLLLSGEGGDPSHATDEGLRIGDREERITEPYPSAVSSDPESDGVRWWDTRSDAGGYTVIASDDVAGPVVEAIGSGFLCIVG